MPRGLDHIVHAVRDLDGAGALYERLGFTVGARNRHPWGTHNRIVQFPGVFIELVSFAEPDRLGTDGFSELFAAYNRDFAATHEGLSMLILQSHEAGRDASDFAAAGIAAGGPLHFEREGKRPDGATVKLAFSLAFAGDPAAPEIHFATCQHHYPENFWNPAFQRHANGATGVAAVTIVAERPAAHRAMLAAFTGAEPTAVGDGLSITLPNGAIEVTTPEDFERRHGLPAPAADEGARLAAIRFWGPGPASAPAALVLGATLLFCAAG